MPRGCRSSPTPRRSRSARSARRSSRSAAVTGIPATTIGMMAGRQLPFVSLIVPAWLVVTMSGWRGLRRCGRRCWCAAARSPSSSSPGATTSASSWSTSPAGSASIFALTLFCRVWQPGDAWESAEVAAPSAGSTASVRRQPGRPSADTRRATRGVARAWMPWVFLSIAVIVWGLHAGEGVRSTRALLAPAWKVPMLHRMVFRDYPVVTAPVDRARIGDAAYRNENAPKPAVFTSTGRRPPAPRSCSRRSSARCTCACRWRSSSTSPARRSGGCARRSPRSC